MSLKVIGAGVGRTGTKSLQLALQQLGFDKCYHMESLFRDPARVKHWEAAHKKANPDWDALFEGFQAAVDFPVSIYYKELAAHYPDAKFILSVRDPEKWYESAFATIFSFEPPASMKLKLLFKAPFSSKVRHFFKVLALNEKSIWKSFFEGKFKDKEFAIQKFKDHIEDVKKTIPADRLLIYQPGDGWEPICEFLGVDVPETPYPRTNLRSNFHDWAMGVVKESFNL
ncbi:MAG: sulfotransferase family protein [Bacteroidota bacterium]